MTDTLPGVDVPTAAAALSGDCPHATSSSEGEGAPFRGPTSSDPETVLPIALASLLTVHAPIVAEEADYGEEGSRDCSDR
jgi:hypothetical protein